MGRFGADQKRSEEIRRDSEDVAGSPGSSCTARHDCKARLPGTAAMQSMLGCNICKTEQKEQNLERTVQCTCLNDLINLILDILKFLNDPQWSSGADFWSVDSALFLDTFGYTSRTSWTSWIWYRCQSCHGHASCRDATVVGLAPSRNGVLNCAKLWREWMDGWLDGWMDGWMDGWWKGDNGEQGRSFQIKIQSTKSTM